MANWQLNQLIKGRQMRTLMVAVFILVMILALVIALLADGSPKKSRSKATMDLTGIVDEPFTEAVAESAMTAQQTELESLKKQLSELSHNIKSMAEEHARQLDAQKEELKSQLTTLAQVTHDQIKAKTESPPELSNVQNQELWHNPNTYAMNGNTLPGVRISHAAPLIHTVSFRPKRRKRAANPYMHLDPKHYVPANTSVRAVVLGGADADASINGQAKNNGVMLFKFLEDGALPNGQRARLRGCRVSSFSYGDISSERALGALYKFTCAYPGQPIIEKKVEGWVFYKGKVGIKGTPVMKDGKVLKWAGISGALSGVASAAQYAQSVQSIGAFGASSIVPSSNIAPFAAFGGASKAADTLSQYYIKRAEQYHPVIPIGAGTEVTIVFKDGFYLEPDEDNKDHAQRQSSPSRTEPYSESLIESNDESANPTDMNFTVPPEVLGKIDHTNNDSRQYAGATP
jgi:conjugal transfer pilus assembly protein TraB